jgi:hypothetical protein
MTPSEMLEKLKQDATPRAVATLEAIFEICIEQKERGINDFSIATIAKLGYKRGVPRAQSLRNKTGECYRALIKCFADANVAGPKEKSEVQSKEDWIEEIANPKHKLLARIQAAELSAAQSKIREFVPPGTRIDVYDHRGSLDDSKAKLTSQERRALEYIISKEFQQKWNFSETVYGELVDSNNKVVLKAATVDAVKKALNHL